MPEKTALVTGANRGIGLEIVRQLARNNFHVFLTARRAEKGRKALEGIQKEGIDSVEFLHLDVSDEESIRKSVADFRKKYDRLDVLINNAGVLIDQGGIVDMPADVLERTLWTNAIGPVMVIQAFLPLMKEGGRIINMSSDLGALHDMGSYKPAYSISKTTLNAITRQFAAALKNRGIAVNTVSPGWVRTDMGGPGATRTVEKGAETAVWLATEAPRNLTGEFLRDKKSLNW